jgi:TRAP-type C4-dicarboxylate transport system permease small subunit
MWRRSVVLDRISNFIYKLENIFFYISGALFLLMMFLGAFDIIGRYLFNKPIGGTMEISSIMMGGIVLLCWAFTQRNHGHVNVELFVSHYSKRMRQVADCVTLSLSFGLFVLIIYQSVLIVIKCSQEDRVLPTLGIPTAPFYTLVPIGAALLCAEILLQIISNVSKLKKG